MSRVPLCTAIVLLCFGLFAGCDGPAGPKGHEVSLADSCAITTRTFQTTQPTFSGRVTSVVVEDFTSPLGPVYQRILGIAAAPDSVLSQSVVVFHGQPVYSKTTGHPAIPENGCAFQVGDSVRVWGNGTVIEGSEESPTVPLYEISQILIVRQDSMAIRGR